MAVAAVLLVLAAIAGAVFLLSRPTTLRIAVGPPDSDDLKLIQGLAQTFVTENSPVRLTVIPTAGAVESLSLLAAGETDMAIGRADEDMPKDAGAVAILRKNVAVLWAPASAAPAKGAKKEAKKDAKKDAKKEKDKDKDKDKDKEAGGPIKEISDLEGRRIGVIGRTLVNVKLLKVILTESGLDAEKVTISRFATSQIAEMVKDTSIDAFMAIGPLDSRITVDAITTTAKLRGEPVFIKIEVSEAIAHKHPLYESEEITGSSFTASPARPDDKVETVGVSHLIVAPKSLSESSIGAFTRALFNVRPTLAKEYTGGSKIQKPNTDKDAAIPAHPGAAAYIDGNERTFLDKYSDYFWGAILLFSVLGSGAAGLRHYTKRDERSVTSQHRDKLLASISLVRRTCSIEELDSLQQDADDFLRETLASFDDGAIAEGDLAAYGLVLEQFHHAIADRRAVIGATAAPTELSRIRA